MFWLLLVTLISVTCAFGSPGKIIPGPTIHAPIGPSRITGGTPVENNDYAYVASLIYYYSIPDIYIQRCTCTIVSSWHLLSSAFCFESAVLSNIQIRAGSLSSTSGGILVRVQNVIKHPDYASQPRRSDIALIRVVTPLIPSDTISVLSIPPQGTELPDNYPVKLAAWGSETEFGTPWELLKKVDIYTINEEVCRERFIGIRDVTEDTICGGTLDQTGVGACTGDWGAPMVIGNVVVGLVSHYHECGNGVYPDIFVKLGDYTNWILAESAN